MNAYRHTVLVVEDDAHVNEMITSVLKLEGYRVESARSGEEGLKKIREVGPDLVMLDVLLPRLDGWDVLSKIRSDPSTSDIPVIILTALSDEKSKVQGLRGGADDYITKPFGTLEVTARVEAVLKRSGRSSGGRAFRSQIPARKGEKIVLVNTDDINFAKVQRNYTYIHTDSDRYLTNHTLSQLEQMLDKEKFFRAHRGYIVNLRKVREISRTGTSTLELTMDDPAGTRIPMSRRQSAELKRLLNI